MIDIKIQTWAAEFDPAVYQREIKNATRRGFRAEMRPFVKTIRTAIRNKVWRAVAVSPEQVKLTPSRLIQRAKFGRLLRQFAYVERKATKPGMVARGQLSFRKAFWMKHLTMGTKPRTAGRDARGRGRGRITGFPFVDRIIGDYDKRIVDVCDDALKESLEKSRRVRQL